MVEIEINNIKYILDFEEKRLLSENGLKVKNSLNLLRLYFNQEGIELPKNANNHSLIGVIKKHMKSEIKKRSVKNEENLDDSNIGKVVISNGEVKPEHFIRHSKKHRTEISAFIREVEHLTETHEVITIKRSLLTPENNYNSFIKENVAKKPGVYIWFDTKNQEVIYIGMAGKIKTSGQLTNHPISKRLQATRSKDVATKKDITTNRYIAAILEIFEVQEIKFHILPCKENEPAAYIESILLYNYFKKNGVLPILNNAY